VGEDLLILCYHAVSEDFPADLSIPPSAFENQIRRKLRSGYRGVTLTQSRAPDRPAKTLVVTFDDGYLSTLTMAAPILDRLGVPGTLFVPTDYIGQDGPLTWSGIEQWSNGRHRSELQPLDWGQVRQLAEGGWEIGSHTCSHPWLTTLADESLDRELLVSRTAIEAELNRPCKTIAYPYGDVNDRVVRAARAAGYELGVGLPGRWRDEGDRMQLPRVGVYRGQGSAKLRLKTSPLGRRLRLLTGR
jgi:peptidoglycan/xylan/chitin deacetylase (PgdA/CDA1 family)